MFNYDAVNNRAVNGSFEDPAAVVLSIDSDSDTINTLSWNDNVVNDFYDLYWSFRSFTSIDDFGVQKISNVTSSYDHIDLDKSIHVYYYRVASVNRAGYTLSNEVNSYGTVNIIYDDLYNRILDQILLNFTPELRRQYHESVLWKSFVDAIASELTTSKVAIKNAIRNSNFQKAKDHFLYLWSNILGFIRRPGEIDYDYRIRLFNNIFFEKVSNIAIRRGLLLDFKYDSYAKETGFAYGYTGGLLQKAEDEALTSINTKNFSNIFKVVVDGVELDNTKKNEIWEYVNNITSLGNVLFNIVATLQIITFDEDFAPFSTIPYGPIYLGWYNADAGNGKTLAVSDIIYMDNQIELDGSKQFYFNGTPDDIVEIERIS